MASWWRFGGKEKVAPAQVFVPKRSAETVFDAELVGTEVAGMELAAKGTLTANAVSLPVSQLDKLPRNGEAWQERAWRLWRSLGVLHYPTNYMAEQVARIRFTVAIDGEALSEAESDKLMEAATRGVGLREAKRLLALHLEVAGEAYYVRFGDRWSIVASTNAAKALEGADTIVRIWQPDPVNPNDADSAVRSVLDEAEEIRVMSALSRSQSRSRISQRGILLVPSEGTFPDGDDFAEDLERSITVSINDEYSAAAVVPPVVTFPSEYIEKWRHLVLENPYDETLHARLNDAIKRLALGLNMPPEILLGVGATNHWSAYLIEEGTYRAHIEPLATFVAQGFAQAVSLASGTEKKITVEIDASELLARRQSVADAFRALELGVVNYAYVRRQIGAEESDAPSPEELQQIILIGQRGGRRKDRQGGANGGLPPVAGSLGEGVESEQDARRTVETLELNASLNGG